MTKEEKWWNRFRKTLDEMPESMEILVDAFGAISAAKRGSSNAFFDKKGHIDNVPTLDLDRWHGKGVENNGSSL